MSNCILARAPSNFTAWAHDDCPWSFSVASVTVSSPIRKTTGWRATKSLPFASSVATSLNSACTFSSSAGSISIE